MSKKAFKMRDLITEYILLYRTTNAVIMMAKTFIKKQIHSITIIQAARTERRKILAQKLFIFFSKVY